MAFRHDIAGGQGNLIVDSVQSPDFVTGSAGWQIRKDGSAEFNDVVIRGGTVVSGLSLYYSGTPALGSLILSIAAAGGTDPYGNTYLAGITSYALGGLTFTQLNGGTIAFNGGGGIQGFSTGAVKIGTGATVVTVAAPLSLPIAITDPGLPLGTAETWHNITLDAGWTSVVTPQYRLLPDGDVEVRGQITHAGVTTAVNINNSNPIPGAYWPAANRVYRPPVAADSAGTVQISSAGVFAMRASGFTATQAILDGIYST